MIGVVGLAVALAAGHGGGAPRTLALDTTGPVATLIVGYTVTERERAAQLRALADRDNSGAVEEAEAPWLEATLGDEAAAGLTLHVDGVPLTLIPRVRAAVGVAGDVRSGGELGIIVELTAASPVWCGVHRIAVGATTRGGAPPALAWPDGTPAAWSQGGYASRWLRVCAR